MLAAVPFDAEEKAAITSLPSDWNNALVAEPSVLPMGGAVVGGVLCEANEESPDTDAELGGECANGGGHNGCTVADDGQNGGCADSDQGSAGAR